MLTTEIEPTSKGEISDGYHTFNELYEHRHALFLALMAETSHCSWIAKTHEDGTMFEGWFVAGIQFPSGDISYHLPIRLWDQAFKAATLRLESSPKFDGHTASDVVDRLYKLIK